MSDDLFDDDLYGFEEEEPRYEAEIKAYERAGPSGILSELLSKPEVIEKKGREILTPEDRFLINTDALSRRMSSERIANLTENDIRNLLSKTREVVGLKYKNYVAYVLGYLASEGGRSLRVKEVNDVITNVLPKLGNEGGVTGPDVVRYARYWREYL